MSRVSIGGQAVMEGVMMKNNDKYAIAVRKPDKEIEVSVTEFVPVGDKNKIFKLPLIRGVFNFVESMVIGIKTLMYSAEFFEDEEGEKEKSKKSGESAVDEMKTEDISIDGEVRKQEKNIENETNVKSADRDAKNKKSKEDSDSAYIFWTVAFSLVIAIGLFMLLPAFLVSLIDGFVKNHIMLAVIEGAIRIAIFLLYVIAISQMEDIKRTFMYHGAEHKTINCLEHDMDLTVENVMLSSRFHKRCGTSFLFVVMFVSIIVFMFVKTDVIWLRLVSRVLLVPVIAGISYEFIRYAGKSESRLANILSKPGLLVQRLTTKEPTPDMVEVAIKSVEGVLDWKKYLEEQRGTKGDKKI